MTDLPDEAASLFREDPERFVGARDALVAEFRSSGRAEEAAAIKALRRPTAMVWALNQLATRDPSSVRELLDAGTELRAAQQATLSSSGTGAERLRTATVARRASVSRLAQIAADLLEEAGRGAKTDEIASALEAASVEEDVGSQLSEGTLERPPPPVSGFGDVFGLTAVAGGVEDPSNDAAPTPTKRRRAPSTLSADDRAEAESEIGRLRRDRDAAARRAQTASATAERLAVRADGMRERLAAAEAEHAEADARTRGAGVEAARAERELAKATERLERLRR